MVKHVYSWKRIWCPPEGHVDMSDDGFLVDPDEPFGATLNPEVVAWDSISSKACLVLLGKPGIGKSSALQSESRRTGESLKGNRRSTALGGPSPL